MFASKSVRRSELTISPLVACSFEKGKPVYPHVKSTTNGGVIVARVSRHPIHVTAIQSSSSLKGSHDRLAMFVHVFYLL
jgi:hypothetical protein